MADIDYSTTKIVTKPISLKAVAELIGESNNDVGAVCVCENINKWAKYKPVKDSTLFPTYTDDFYRQSDASYTTQRIYAMLVTQANPYNGDKDALTLYDTDEEDECNWKYDQPVKDGGLPFRLGDFGGISDNGYYHAATQFCTSANFKKDQIDNIYVSSDSEETDTVRFYVDGIMNKGQGGISFSDLSAMSEAKLVLCANIYKLNESELTYDYIAEYINHNIKLFDTSLESDFKTESDDGILYDDTDDRWKFVDVVFDKDTYFNSSASSATYKYIVIITLDFVKYDSTNSQWISTRKITIPYSDDNYWMKEIDIEKQGRVLQAIEYQAGNDGTSITWESYNTPITNYNLVMSPRVHFSISKTATPITIVSVGGTGYWIRTKYTYTDSSTGEAVTVTRDGSLFSATGSGIEIDADKESSTTVDFYYQFSNVFGHTEESYYVTGHYYTCQLYLVDNTSGNAVETLVGSMFIIKG